MRTTSSTRVAWYPLSASAATPASSRLVIVRRPCVRSSRPAIGDAGPLARLVLAAATIGSGGAIARPGDPTGRRAVGRSYRPGGGERVVPVVRGAGPDLRRG